MEALLFRRRCAAGAKRAIGSIVIICPYNARIASAAKFTTLRLAIALVAAVGLTCTASATTTRVIVPFGPGSLADIVPRIVFKQISADFHEPIVIENKPGAGSLIGAAAVAKAVPDGATLLATSSAHVIAPLLQANPPFDSQRDFSAVTSLGLITDVLVVSSQTKITTLRQFVNRARSHSATFASLGVGSGIYMNALRFAHSAGFTPVNVSFKGAPEALAEIMRGQVDFCFCAIGTALPYIRSGALTALAVSSRARSQRLPDIPTTLEEGYADSDYSVWIGVFAPGNTPAKRIEEIARMIRTSLQSEALREKLLNLGVEPLVMTPAQFERFVDHDRDVNAAILKAAGKAARQ